MFEIHFRHNFCSGNTFDSEIDNFGAYARHLVTRANTKVCQFRRSLSVRIRQPSIFKVPEAGSGRERQQ